MLMDGSPVLNVTCYDHINLSSVLIDITLLPLGLSQSVTLHCKFSLEEPKMPEHFINQPFLFLLPPFLFSTTFLLFVSGFFSFRLFNPSDFHSILIPLFLYLLFSSPYSLTGISRRSERKSEGIRLGLKCNIRLLKRLVVDISLSELPPKLMN